LTKQKGKKKGFLPSRMNSGRRKACAGFSAAEKGGGKTVSPKKRGTVRLAEKVRGRNLTRDFFPEKKGVINKLERSSQKKEERRAGPP